MERISLKTHWQGRGEHVESFGDSLELMRRVKGFEAERNSTCPVFVEIYVDRKKVISVPGREIGSFNGFIESLGVSF